MPTIASVYYSFTSWDGLNPVVKFVGLANYKEDFTSARFGNALKNTVILTAFICSGKQLALILALIVDNEMGEGISSERFLRSVLISGIVSGFIWKIMYNYNFGAVNTIFRSLGMGEYCQDWLGNRSWL